MYGKHTNFDGFKLVTDLEVNIGEPSVYVFDVKLLNDDAADCDFCIDNHGQALYEIDATAELGNAGYNTIYCQDCAVTAANSRQVDYWAMTAEEAREAKAHAF